MTSNVGAGRDAADGAVDLSETTVIDLEHLDRFTFADRALQAEVLGLFAEQLPVTIAWLETAASEKDWRNAAHTLKGSARAVGALRLARAAEAAEQATCDIAARRRCLRAIVSEAAAAQSAIERLAAMRAPGA